MWISVAHCAGDGIINIYISIISLARLITFSPVAQEEKLTRDDKAREKVTTGTWHIPNTFI